MLKCRTYVQLDVPWKDMDKDGFSIDVVIASSEGCRKRPPCSEYAPSSHTLQAPCSAITIVRELITQRMAKNIA